MLEISSIIAIVVGVSQIILFFKIWGMTNDVKRIADKLGCSEKGMTKVKAALLDGNKEEAARLLKESLIHEMLSFADGEGSDRFANIGQMKGEYRKRFAQIGIDELPESIANINDVKDIRKLVTDL